MSRVTKAFNPIPIGYDNIVSILFLGYLQLSCSDYFSLEKITCYNTLGLFVNDVAPIVIIVKVSSTFWLLKLGMHLFLACNCVNFLARVREEEGF